MNEFQEFINQAAEQIAYFLHVFVVFNINAFYSVVYFMKNNILFGIVLIAIGYIIYEDCKATTTDYVEDERGII